MFVEHVREGDTSGLNMSTSSTSSTASGFGTTGTSTSRGTSM
jgi:hypothetical protein